MQMYELEGKVKFSWMKNQVVNELKIIGIDVKADGRTYSQSFAQTYFITPDEVEKEVDLTGVLLYVPRSNETRSATLILKYQLDDLASHSQNYDISLLGSPINEKIEKMVEVGQFVKRSDGNYIATIAGKYTKNDKPIAEQNVSLAIPANGVNVCGCDLSGLTTKTDKGGYFALDIPLASSYIDSNNTFTYIVNINNASTFWDFKVKKPKVNSLTDTNVVFNENIEVDYNTTSYMFGGYIYDDETNEGIQTNVSYVVSTGQKGSIPTDIFGGFNIPISFPQNDTSSDKKYTIKLQVSNWSSKAITITQHAKPNANNGNGGAGNNNGNGGTNNGSGLVDVYKLDLVDNGPFNVSAEAPQEVSIQVKLSKNNYLGVIEDGTKIRYNIKEGIEYIESGVSTDPNTQYISTTSGLATLKIKLNKNIKVSSPARNVVVYFTYAKTQPVKTEDVTITQAKSPN